jgi:O-antigen ligase
MIPGTDGDMIVSRIRAARRWTLRVGLFLLPLAFLPNTYDRWVLPKLLLARLLVLVLAGLLAAQALREKTLIVKRTPLDLPFAAFLISAAISTALAVNLNVAIFGTYSRYDGLLTLLSYAALFWLAVQTLEGPEDAWALLRGLLASAYVVAAIAIAQSVIESASPSGLVLQGTEVVQGSVVRAYGSFGQWEVLAEFLLLAWPVALWELAVARTVAARALGVNAALVIGIALALTFSRSAWAATVIATAVLATGLRPWRDRRVLITTLIGVVGIAVLIGALALAGGSGFEGTVLRRATQLRDIRPSIWHDSLGLIASRPLFGFGPDNFGLVFGRFATVDYHLPIDKAHAELLQIAATQGLAGVAAYMWLMGAFVVAFWRRRTDRRAYVLFAAFIAYEAMLQVNFTALGSAFPFWIFAAACMHSWHAVSSRPAVQVSQRVAAGLRIALPALGVAVVAGVLLPYVADVSLQAGVSADWSGDVTEARWQADRAQLLGPRESVYAVEAGNVAFEKGDWKAARDAYTRAATLGTYNSFVYRNLATSDRELGLTTEARHAAQMAYALDRFDPVNQAFMAQFGQARNGNRSLTDSKA